MQDLMLKYGLDKYEYSDELAPIIKEFLIEKEDKCYLSEDSTMGVVNYLISFYFRTGLKYHYYRQKINRLLTIYKLCSLKYNTKALEYELIIGDDGRMGAMLGMYSPFDNRYEATTQENGAEITETIEDYNYDKCYISREYIYYAQKLGIKEIKISQEARDLLELIFRKFGNYSTQELGPIIDEIVTKLPIQKLKNSPYYFEKDKEFEKFIASNEEILKDNIVFSFIRDFDRLNIRKFYNKNQNNIDQDHQKIIKKY